jgi:hypothetical protein
MTTYRIGVKQKRLWLPRLESHYGKICFYCQTPFMNDQHRLAGMTNPYLRELDHLNDAEHDNRIENVVQAHKMCNSKKRYSQPMKDKALEQLRLNESTGIPEINEALDLSDDQKENEKERDSNDEIYSNVEFMKISKEYLESKLQGDTTRLPYKSTLDSIAMRCFKRVGHGSPVSIRRAIDMLCSDEGDYYKYRDGGKQWISRENPLFTN